MDAHSNATWLVFVAEEVVDDVEFLAQRVAKNVQFTGAALASCPTLIYIHPFHYTSTRFTQCSLSFKLLRS